MNGGKSVLSRQEGRTFLSLSVFFPAVEQIFRLEEGGGRVIVSERIRAFRPHLPAGVMPPWPPEEIAKKDNKAIPGREDGQVRKASPVTLVLSKFFNNIKH